MADGFENPADGGRAAATAAGGERVRASLDWFSVRWLAAEKMRLTKLIRGGPPDRVAWELLQWWPDPCGDEDEPIDDPAHRANLRAANAHIRARLAEPGPAGRAAVAASMRRIGCSHPSRGGIFVAEMPLREKARRTNQLLTLFDLAGPGAGADGNSCLGSRRSP